jgi:two-component system cell cycle response regulator
MVTALNEVGDMERARESGGDDFLCKPVNKLELLARVRNLLTIRQRRQTPNRRSREGEPPVEPPPA